DLRRRREAAHLVGIAGVALVLQLAADRLVEAVALVADLGDRSVALDPPLAAVAEHELARTGGEVAPHHLEQPRLAAVEAAADDGCARHRPRRKRDREGHLEITGV